MNKKIYKFHNFLYSFSFTFLALLMIINLFGDAKRNNSDVIYAKEVLGFDNEFDFDSISNDNTSSSNEFVHYSEAITATDEELITSDTLAYEYLVTNPNHKIIVISNVDELINFSTRCNGIYRRYYLSFHYVLGNDITFNGQQFVAIGTYAYPFSGIFDGQGFEIDKMIIERITDKDKYQKKIAFNDGEDNKLEQKYEYHSMFSYNNGTIKNLGIINETLIQLEEFSSLSDDKNLDSYASFLVGENLSDGEVSYCYVIDDAKSKEDDKLIPGITAYGFQIAGLVCNNNGSFHDNYAKIDILYEEIQIEGSTIEAPLYVQPICIRTSKEMKNNYYDGAIYTSLPSYTVDTSINVAIGNLGESNVFINDNYFVKNEKWHTPIDYGSYGITFDYPKLLGLTRDKDENGDYTNDLLIKKPYDLIIMKNLIDNHNSVFKNTTFILNNDIDMSSLAKDIYTPITGQFQGTFKSKLKDSSKYTAKAINNKYPCAIANLVINTDSTLTNNVAMFINLTNATIKDLYFVNASISNNTNYNISTDSKLVAAILACNTHSNNKLTTIENVHINSNVKISSSNEVRFGSFIGEINNGSVLINNCSTSGTFDGTSSKNNTKTSYIGGFVGYSNDVTITNSFNNLEITSLATNSQTNDATVYTGGVVGGGIINSLSKVGNKADIYTYSLKAIGTSTTSSYVLKSVTGGIIGVHNGYVKDTTNETYGHVSLVTNEGNIYTQAYYNANKADKILLMASGYGIVDFENKELDSSNNVFKGITNKGSLDIYNYNVTSPAALTKMSQDQLLGTRGYFLTPGMIVLNTSCDIDGLYNLKYQTVDISLLPSYAPNLYTSNYPTIINNKTVDFVINLTRSYNKGNINFVTNNDDYGFNHKLTGNALGKYINYNEIRNEGNLFLNVTKNINVSMNVNSINLGKGTNQLNEPITHPYDSYTFTLTKTIRIDGLFDVLNPGCVAKNLYNGGNIAVNYSTSGLKVYAMLYISGICYKNENRDIYNGTIFENNIQQISDSIVFPSSMQGSIHNAINNGEIVVNSPQQWFGCIRIGGIATINESLITSAFNLGDITIYNKTPAITGSGFNGSGQFENEVGGIVFQMHSAYAAIMDSANYGNIIIYSDSSEGYALAGGIAGRNDKEEGGSDLSNSSSDEAKLLKGNAYVGRLLFCINYGDIYTWTNRTEDTSEGSFWHGIITGQHNTTTGGKNYNNGEYATKSGGMVGNGLMSIVDCMNFGNMYSKYSAGGIYANIRTDVFGLQNAKYIVYVSNTVNYGGIEKINGVAKINEPLISLNTNNTLKFENLVSTDSFTSTGITGKIGNATYGTDYSINERWHFGGIIGNLYGSISARFFSKIIISCLYNFNDDVDVIGFCDKTGTSTDLSTIGQTFIEYMGTTKSSTVSDDGKNDTSPYPFNNGTSYSIKSYTHDENGVFSDSFPLKNPKTISSNNIASNAYIEDYFKYIPYDNVGDILKKKLQITTKQGIYGLSSSTTILDGIFMPENVDLVSLSPLKIDDNGNVIRDDSWYGAFSEESTVYWKLYNAMKQQKDSMAATIYDLQLKDDNGHILADPIIDQDNKIISYYIAKNADEYYSTNSTYSTTITTLEGELSNNNETITYYASQSNTNAAFPSKNFPILKANLNKNTLEYEVDKSSISNYIDKDTLNASSDKNTCEVDNNNIQITYNTFKIKYNSNNPTLYLNSSSSTSLEISTNLSTGNLDFTFLTSSDIENIKNATESIQSIGATTIAENVNYYIYNPKTKAYLKTISNTSISISQTSFVAEASIFKIKYVSNWNSSGYIIYSSTSGNLNSSSICLSYSGNSNYSVIAKNYSYYASNMYWTFTNNSTISNAKQVTVSYPKYYTANIITYIPNYYVNLDSSTYKLAPNASLLKNDETTSTKLGLISLPYSYEDSNNNLYEVYTSSKVKCYSQAYLRGLTGSEYYSEYEIRIYLIENKEYNKFKEIEIDNNAADSTESGNVTIVTTEMASEITSTTGLIKFSMDVKNIAYNQNLTRNLTIFNSKGEDVTSMFILDSSLANNGIVVNTSTSIYEKGTVTFKYKASDNTPGDTYRILLKLNDSVTKELVFTKTKSSRNFVESFTFNGEKYVNTESENSTTSTILYGSFYNELLKESCDYLNFSSLNNTIPSYLTSFKISSFATLNNITMAYTKTNGLYVYTIAYDITAEDGTNNIFTHIIMEENPSNAIKDIYKGSDNDTSLSSPITITRDEIPTFRVYYSFDSFYFSSEKEFLNAKISYVSTTNSDAFIISKLVKNDNNYVITFENGQTYSYTVNNDNKVGNTIYIDDNNYWCIGTTNTLKDATSISIKSIEKENSANLYNITFSDNSVVQYGLSSKENNDLGLYVDDNQNWLIGNTSMNIGMSFINYDIKFYNNEYMAIYLPAIAPTGTYTISVSYAHDDFKDTPVYSWDYSFEDLKIIKTKSADSHLKNIIFTSESAITGQNTIIDVNEFTVEEFENAYHNSSSRKILVSQRGINYKEYSTNTTYYVVGEVASTDLSSYAPSFVLPTGAYIKKGIVDANNNLSFSDDLRSDYNPVDSSGESFNYIYYRVFAEDYDDSATSTTSSHYTDYYISVIDRTYTVKFDIKVILSDKINEELNRKNIYTTLTRYLYDKDNNSYNLDNPLDYSSMFVFINNNQTTYDKNNGIGYVKDDSNTIYSCDFPSNVSGYYKIFLDLPNGYSFTYKITNISNDSYEANKEFAAIANLIPKKFTLEITIIKKESNNNWGEIGIIDTF